MFQRQQLGIVLQDSSLCSSFFGGFFFSSEAHCVHRNRKGEDVKVAEDNIGL